MNRDGVRRGLLLVALLGAGMLVRRLRPPPAGVSDPGTSAVVWLGRPADLILQVCLMLTGALGIRALLPSDEDEEEEEEADARLE